MPFLLPDSPATNTVCVSIKIPDTPQDVRNFLGQLLTLSQWFNYEKTGTNLGKLVADTWRDANESVLIGVCEGMIVRQNEMNPCILESSVDNGENWVQFADITSCVNDAFMQNGIIDAINNSELVRDSITNVTIRNIYSEGIAENWMYTALSDLSCNEDNLFGYVTALWEFIHLSNLDLLEQIEEASNQFEVMNTLAKVIPLFEQLPVSDALTWIGDLGSYNKTAYESSYTVIIGQQIACDLFCIALDNECSLTMELVWEYLVEKFGGLNFPTLGATFLEMITFMFTANYPNDRIVYLWSLVQLGIVFIGAEFLGLNTVNVYGIQAQAGDPSNDWTLLCDPCNPPITEQCFNFVGQTDGWSESSSTGEFIPSGYRMRTNQQYAVGSLYMALNSLNQITLDTISSMKIDWDSTNCNATNGNININYIRYNYTDSTQEELEMTNFSFPMNQAVQSITYDLPPSNPAKVVESINLQYDSANAGNTGYMLVTGICLYP